MRYMREYAPENQVTNFVQTLPEPQKGVYQDALVGMSWSRNELITLTLPKSGVARGQHRCTHVNR